METEVIDAFAKAQTLGTIDFVVQNLGPNMPPPDGPDMRKMSSGFMKYMWDINFLISNKIAKSTGDFISHLIPGEGTTEVSLDLRENYKPDFSILGVREIEKNSSDNTFIQFSLSNTEKSKGMRIVKKCKRNSYHT